MPAFHRGAPQLNGYIKLYIAPHLLKQYTPIWEQSLVLPFLHPFRATLVEPPPATFIQPASCCLASAPQRQDSRVPSRASSTSSSTVSLSPLHFSPSLLPPSRMWNCRGSTARNYSRTRPRPTNHTSFVSPPTITSTPQVTQCRCLWTLTLPAL